MITKTVGPVAGDFVNFKYAIQWFSAGDRGDDVTFDQIENVDEGLLSGPITTRSYGHSIKMTCSWNEAHKDDVTQWLYTKHTGGAPPGFQWQTYAIVNYNCHLEISYIKYRFLCKGNYVINAYIQSGATQLNFTIDSCIFSRFPGDTVYPSLGGLALSNSNGVTNIVKNCIFNSVDYPIIISSDLTTGSVHIENCAVYNCATGITKYNTGNFNHVTIKNLYAFNCSLYCFDVAGMPGLTYINDVSDDATLDGVGTDCLFNFDYSNDLKSVDFDNADFLKLKDGAVGILAASGTIPTYTTTDIAGLVIPYAGNSPVGPYVSVVEAEKEFPEMIIDSGMAYKDYGLETETIIGATRGGNKFWIEQEIEDSGYDGRGANVLGAKKIVRVQPFIETNIIEISADLINSALPASEIASGTNYNTITRALQISLSDYCDNITIVGEIHGNERPIICMIKNALCVSNFSMENNDRDETKLTLKFGGHFAADNLNEEPWEIRYPVGD